MNFADGVGREIGGGEEGPIYSSIAQMTLEDFAYFFFFQVYHDIPYIVPSILDGFGSV